MPTAVQRETLPVLLEGRDIIIQACSGSGSTTATLIAILQKINPASKETEAVIVTPTRESAMNVGMLVRHLGDYINAKCLDCVVRRGLTIPDNMVDGPRQIVVGTPGRLLEALTSGPLVPDHIKMLCFDDIDELLARGFEDQIGLLSQLCSRSTQIVFTRSNPAGSDEIHVLSMKIMQDPVHHRMPSFKEYTVEGHKQFYIDIEKEEWKLDTLFDLYETVSVNQSVIFCNRKHKVEWLGEKMREKEFSVSAMHADQDACERAKLRNDFRTGDAHVLIATDRIARGLDVPPVTLIIHYDLPEEPQSYMHRIGRGNRFRVNNPTILFATAEDKDTLRILEQFYDTQIPEMPLNIADLI